MVEKKINYKKLIIVSLILAILIFSSGILIGLTLDEFRANDVTDYLNQNELQTESYLIERQFLDNFNQDECSLAQPRVEQLSEQLGEIGRTLARYESKKIFSKSTFESLKQKYFLFEIKLYVILKEINDRCNNQNKAVILFFYDTEHQESLQQGYALDALVVKDEITVFSIDRQFSKDPLIETVKQHYNITKSPTLIINFNKTLEGYASLAELTKAIKDEKG